MAHHLDVNAAVDPVDRSDWGRIVATLIRLVRDFDVAEEAAQEAFAAAVDQWGVKGPFDLMTASRGLPSEKTQTGKAVTLGESQRAQQHNAVAVTLVVQATRCYSMVGGTRMDWQRDVVMVTPPTDMHSHHNEGDELALFLIVQD